MGVDLVDLVDVVGDVHGFYLEDINQSYYYLISCCGAAPLISDLH